MLTQLIFTTMMLQQGGPRSPIYVKCDTSVGRPIHCMTFAPNPPKICLPVLPIEQQRGVVPDLFCEVRRGQAVYTAVLRYAGGEL